MGPRRRTAGFTLIELMIVAAIISIFALAFQPSFAKNIAQKRAISAASEFVRIGRRARADAIGLQRAHLMVIEPGAGAQATGRVSLLRGNSVHCELEPWANHFARCVDPPPPGSECVERLDLNNTHWYHQPFSIVLGGPARTTSLCFEPHGTVQWSRDTTLNPTTFSTLAKGDAVSGGFLWTMSLIQEGGDVVNVPVVLATPLGGPPRRLR